MLSKCGTHLLRLCGILQSIENTIAIACKLPNCESLTITEEFRKAAALEVEKLAQIDYQNISRKTVEKAIQLLDYFNDPYEIYQRFEEQVDVVIDGGYGRLDASTVVDCTSGAPEIIRQGIGELIS